MAQKVKCKICGTECCRCTGCDTSKYIDSVCPSCQKKLKNDSSENNSMQGLQQSQGSVSTDRMQSS
jgi:hypothetical protein